MKKIRKIIFILFKLCILSLLINSMLLFISESKVPLSDFINQGFKSVYIINNNGENEFIFIKIVTLLAIYLVMDMNLIYHVSYLSSGMKEIVKYHSKNKLEYIKNLIIISQKAILVSLLYWIYGLLICIFIFNKVFINNINDIFILIGFILLNYFVAIFIVIFGYNSLIVILMFVSKYFIFSVFLGKEDILIYIMIIVILGYFLNNRKVRNILWRL